MTAPEEQAFAWEPITPLGVAAFARATPGRLMLVQFVVAFIVAMVMAWSLYQNWCPVIGEAIEKLPDEGEIRSGRLTWTNATPVLLAEGTFLAVSVDLEHASDLVSPAHVQAEFGRETLFLHSLLGYSEVRYPEKWIIAFNRKELKPAWGAWRPALLAAAVITVVVVLMVVWYALATIYTLPVWLVAFFGNRDLRLGEACRLAGAALMPGALLMVLGMLLYDLGLIDLVGLGFVLAGHFVLGWLYLFISPLFLPKHSEVASTAKNPFASSEKK